MCGDELSSCLLQVPDTVGEVLRETARQYENQTAAKLLVDFVEYKVRFAHHQCEQGNGRYQTYSLRKTWRHL